MSPQIRLAWMSSLVSTAVFSIPANGDWEDFFSSARGIFQGCSLSPYLYVILNNFLSKLLNKAAKVGKFDYHPSCKIVGLTHLSFVDDIFVFTDGLPSSLDGVLMVMEEFARISGLRINVSKSSIFTAVVGGTVMSDSAAAASITVGSLPIRYLGLPLTTKSMTRQDYESLLDKMRSLFLPWTNKNLSFAGRLQLIKSMINSFSNFWCSIFRFPSCCLDAIERMCGAFLWSGTPNDTHKSKVNWEDLCLPKEDGALGVRCLRDSSRVFALSLIFEILYTLWFSMDSMDAP